MLGGPAKLDMRGDNGLGVITGAKLQFEEGDHDGTIVPHADQFHYWAIREGPYSQDSRGENVKTAFYSYLIGPDGPMQTPVISKVPLDLGGYTYGSPDGSTLVEDVFLDTVSGYGGIGVFHIDKRTGEVTLRHVIQQPDYLYPSVGALPWAFSPDGNVLYYSTDDHRDTTSYLLQYDLSRLDVSDTPYVVASAGHGHAFSQDIALTGNGRIYGISDYYRIDKQGFPIGYWYSIASPDSIGAACHFEDTAFSSGRTQGCSIWNGVARVVHSKLQQISTVPLPSCQSTAYSFSRPDADGFPHWTFDGGNPATASGSVIPQVLFDSAGAHTVLAVTSTGDTLMTLVAAGVTTGSARPLAPATATVTPGSNYTLPVHLLLNYSDPNDTIGHLMQEYVINFDTTILSLPANASQAISLPPQDEIVSARQTDGSLKLIIEDTLGTSWWSTNTFSWRDSVDSISIKFRVTKSDNWHSTPVTLALFSIDDGYGTRHDFCPEENSLLATITNANSGISGPEQTANITLVPNPTTGLLTIFGAAGAVTVTNVLGERVAGTGETTPQPPPSPLRSAGGGVTVDLSKLPAGAYFVRIETASGMVVRKVLKE